MIEGQIDPETVEWSRAPEWRGPSRCRWARRRSTGRRSARDPGGMLGDVLAMPLQLGDALWRAQSAGVRAADSPAGLVVCGMGGSAIEATSPSPRWETGPHLISVVRGFALDVDSAETFVLCSSFSGRPRRRWPASRPPARGRPPRDAHRQRHARGSGPGRGRPRGRRAPSGMQPRASRWSTGRSRRSRCAALVWGRTLLHAEIDTATALLERLVEEWGPGASDNSLAKRIARGPAGTVPVIHGSGSTEAVARRWHTQILANVKTSAFWSGLPEANHHEICGWEQGPARAPCRPCSPTPRPRQSAPAWSGAST